MKNLLIARFTNFGLSDNINLLFLRQIENFDINKLLVAIDSDEPINFLKAQNDNFLNLLYILADMDKAFINFKKHNIPDEIILDSLADVKVWVLNLYNATKEVGLAELEWECCVHRSEVIKIGRLQFQPYKAEYDFVPLNLKKGDNVINMHIQEGGGMTPEACKKSVENAREFFKTYFPDFKYTHMVCHSWLLDPALITMVKPDSNIAAFYNMFDIVVTEYANSAIKRIYGPDAEKPYKEFSENSSLQRNMKAYLLGGGKLSVGYGVLKI